MFVQRLMGHGDKNTTVSLYSRIVESLKKAAIEDAGRKSVKEVG